jgi:hypothetical protein
MNKRTPATVLQAVFSETRVAKGVGKIQRKRISISSKNNSEKKKGHREKNWARERETF